MLYQNKIWMAKNENPIYLLTEMSNRHGLITGATGTGKTVTVKVMAEAFSDAGVPVFLSDIKGDLAGMSQPGIDSEDMQARIAKFGLAEAGWTYKSYPTTYWDVFGKKGIPVRTTISEMGPLLLSRLMDLTDVQEGVLNIIFKIADDQRLLLLDLKDLRAMVQAVGDHAAQYKTAYGNITAASIGAIQRGLLKLETQGGNMFFGEPALDIADWMSVDASGKGMINVLNCEELFQNSDLYSAFLLWMLSELYDRLPEAGDLAKPKMVFFFDEAHLLFKTKSKELLEKVEQVVRLIRSKGVGVYFITQTPMDIPDTVLSQLGNKIQHALRAYTPAEQKTIKAVAQSFVVNPAFDTEETITQLAKGEALVSFLDENGVPQMVQRANILPPQSKMGTIDLSVMQQMIAASPMSAKYGMMIDRESAYELLVGKVAGTPVQQANVQQAQNVQMQQQIQPQAQQTMQNMQQQQNQLQQTYTAQPVAANTQMQCDTSQTQTYVNQTAQVQQQMAQDVQAQHAQQNQYVQQPQAVSQNQVYTNQATPVQQHVNQTQAFINKKYKKQASQESRGQVNQAQTMQSSAAQTTAPQTQTAGYQSQAPNLVDLVNNDAAAQTAAEAEKTTTKTTSKSTKSSTRQTRSRADKVVDSMLTSAGRTASSTLVRGIMKSLLK